MQILPPNMAFLVWVLPGASTCLISLTISGTINNYRLNPVCRAFSHLGDGTQGGMMSSQTRIRIGLVGDYNPLVIAHQAIPRALSLAGKALEISVDQEWLPTQQIRSPGRVEGFDGLWCVPATPYKSMQGALCAIQFARQQGRPFLGTCGGFQHAIIEYARSVLGWVDADHAETAPDAARLVITPLACALVEVTDKIRLLDPSRLADAYQCLEITEGYHCTYGMNPRFRAQLASGPLRVVAEDISGEVRAVELDDHPFFVATLFQPERLALQHRLPPIVAAFVLAAASNQAASA
jgi:CTP synthase (UTP-ammonia lyase)